MMSARHLRISPARPFGRRRTPLAATESAQAAISASDDLRLFAMTFAGGFLFMTVFLA